MNKSLLGYRVLVVEDEYFLADELRTELTDAGAEVVGPVGTVGGAVELIDGESQIDAAVLDLNLGGMPAYPAVDRLAERKVPIVFVTGYDTTAIPSRYSHIAVCEKPAHVEKIAAAIKQAMD